MDTTGRRLSCAAAAAVLLLATAACGPLWPGGPSATPESTPRTSAGAAGARPATAAPPGPPVVDVAYRLDRRTHDAATGDFEAVVRTTLIDPRGWQRAGFRFSERQDATFVVVLAEPDTVQHLCRPYDVRRRYSCQNGPVVALNADRWRHATPEWTGDLPAYRQMLVNHEVGHLLGQRHPPRPQCPQPGRPAPVMAQQSTELDGCLPNPWPLREEIERAARHDQPLAPPHGR